MPVEKKTGSRRTAGTARSPREPESPALRRRTLPAGTTPPPPSPLPDPALAPTAIKSGETPGEAAFLPVVVGVGASAGGLEAFTELLGHLPDTTGMAFVLIQHLDPNHDSHLTELLTRATQMPVSEVNGDTLIEPNHVYVISPKRNLSIAGGALNTLARPATGHNMPGDAFFPPFA